MEMQRQFIDGTYLCRSTERMERLCKPSSNYIGYTVCYRLNGNRTYHYVPARKRWWNAETQNVLKTQELLGGTMERLYGTTPLLSPPVPPPIGGERRKGGTVAMKRRFDLRLASPPTNAL
jgi:hypothetical protein